jgi:hypothetical protein
VQSLVTALHLVPKLEEDSAYVSLGEQVMEVLAYLVALRDLVPENVSFLFAREAQVFSALGHPGVMLENDRRLSPLVGDLVELLVGANSDAFGALSAGVLARLPWPCNNGIIVSRADGGVDMRPAPDRADPIVERSPTSRLEGCHVFIAIDAHLAALALEARHGVDDAAVIVK